MKRLGKNSFDTILLISVSGERPKSQRFHHSWSIFLAVGIHRHDLQLGQASSFHAIYVRIKQEITYSLLFSECPTLCWSNVNTFSWHCFGVPRHQSAGFAWEWEWAPLVLSEGFFFFNWTFLTQVFHDVIMLSKNSSLNSSSVLYRFCAQCKRPLSTHTCLNVIPED